MTALVRANYQNLQKGIYKETIHLERFFRNLLMGVDNVLMNRDDDKIKSSEKNRKARILIMIDRL